MFDKIKEIRVHYDDEPWCGWGTVAEIKAQAKAAELFLALYKETGEEYQKKRAEKLADKIAETVRANATNYGDRIV